MRATQPVRNLVPATKSTLIVRFFLAASKSTPFTYHGLAIPNAASKSLFCTHMPSPSPYMRPAWQGRSGRRDGLFDQTKGWKNNRRQTAKPSARTHSNFKRGAKDWCRPRHLQSLTEPALLQDPQI